MNTRILIKDGNKEKCEHEFEEILGGNDYNYYKIRLIKIKCIHCNRIEEETRKR